ncbi:fimbrial protein [Yokenella regensburgei]|uniref:fimbrial protein n=1 Tax=Yokenella regensburgei TaxID=158877 RepID=UPI003ED9DE58
MRNVQIYPTNGDVGLSSNIGVVSYNTPSAVNLTVRPPRDTPTTINQVVNFGVGTYILIHYNNSEYVSSQPFFSGPFNVPFFQVESADGQYLYYRFILKGTARYIPVLLRNENTTVDLPPVSSSVFQGVGSVAGRTPIPLEIVSSNVNSQNFITFDAITVRNGNIIIPDSGAATGVGFQIVNAASGTPVQLGQPLSVPGNINGSFSNYSAQYIQVADRVDGGKVSAVVTMTLTYQ